LLIFNPPYQFEQRAQLWQPELQGLLDKPGQGGNATRWLIAEAGMDHAHA
jgi:23S rRNA A2030 N6-methylase RlmJ